MALAAVGMIAAHAGCWILAAALLGKLLGTPRLRDLPGLVVLDWLIVTLIVLVAGSLRILGPASLILAGVGAGAVGVALGGHRVCRALADGMRTALRETWRESPLVTGTAGIVVAAIAVRHLLNIWWFAPYTQDELEYHLPKLASWIQHGDLVRPVMLDTRSYFPSGMQILQVWWVGILRHDGFIEGASMEALVLAVVSTASLGRRLGMNRGAALAAGALFAAAPAVVLHATTALNDLPACALILAAFALAASKTTLPLAAAAVLLGSGVKPIVLFVAPAVAILAIPAWRESIPLPRVAAALVVGAATVAGGYWYGLNAAEFGNPVHPVPLGSASPAKVSMGPATVSTRPSITRLARNAIAVFGTRMYAAGATTNPMLPDRTGWGWILALGGLPAILWVLWRRDALWRRTAAAFAAAGVLVLLMVEHDAWNARFVLFLAAGAACAMAAGAERLGPLAGTALLVVSLAGIWEARLPVTFANPGAAEHMRGLPWADRDTSVVSFQGGAPGLRPFLDSREAVLCVSFNFPVYAIARGDFHRRVEHAVADDADRLRAMMNERHCRWLVTVGAPATVQDAADGLVRRGELRAVGPGLYERP